MAFLSAYRDTFPVENYNPPPGYYIGNDPKEQTVKIICNVRHFNFHYLNLHRIPINRALHLQKLKGFKSLIQKSIHQSLAKVIKSEILTTSIKISLVSIR